MGPFRLFLDLIFRGFALVETGFRGAMMMDVDQVAKAMRDAQIDAEIEDFIEGFNQATCRGMRVDGVQVPVWSSHPAGAGCKTREGRSVLLRLPTAAIFETRWGCHSACVSVAPMDR